MSWTLIGCTRQTPLAPTKSGLADVTAVTASGSDGDWTFSVTLQSPETGCDRYADWWEVLTEDGALAYRRVLAHSHPNEQPFTRSGGSVPVGGDQVVIVRGHMAPGGYGGKAMRGTVNGGFIVDADLPADFAIDVETQPPLPSGCAF
ncbi:MAG: hypothetical protein AAFV53_04635 [Myxococcota bacterium]